MSPTAKYVGDGADYHTGIPARDLTEEEFDALTEEQQATVSASPLYEVAGAAARSAPAEKKTAATKDGE